MFPILHSLPSVIFTDVDPISHVTIWPSTCCQHDPSNSFYTYGFLDLLCSCEDYGPGHCWLKENIETFGADLTPL